MARTDEHEIFDSLRTAAEQLRVRSEEAAAARARVEVLLAGEDKARAAASGPLAVFVIDRTGRIDGTAGAILVRLGMRPEDLAGRSIFDVYADRPEFIDAIRRALAGEESVVRMVVAESAMEIRTAPVRDREGRPGGALSVWIDVTERERAATMLKQAEEQLGAVLAQRSQHNGNGHEPALTAELAHKDHLLRTAAERERAQAAELASLRSESDDARSQATALRAQYDRAAADLAHAQERMRAATADAATARAQADVAMRQADEARSRAQAATSEAGSARIEAIEAGARMRTAVDDAASVRGEIARLEEALKSSQRDAETARQRGDALRIEIEAARAAAARSDERIGQLTAEIERMRDDNSRLRQDALDSRERETAALTSASEARAQADAAASAAASSTLLAETSAQELAKERAERERLSNDLRSVSQRLNVAVDEAARARTRTQETEELFRASTHDASAARTLAESVGRDADEARAHAQAARAELTATRAERDAANSALAEARQQIEAMSQELSSLRIGSAEIEARLRAAEADAADARSGSDATERQVAQAMAAIDAATAEAAAARTRAAEAERRLETLSAARLTFVGDAKAELTITPRDGSEAESPTVAAGHDALTGLPGRALLLAMLAPTIEQHQDGAPLCMLLLDIDNFKDINDTFGHQTGDQIIRQTADRIRNSVRDGDIVARLGGDEFAVVLPGTDVETAVGLTRTILQAIERPFTGADQEFDVQASVGVAPCSAQGVTAHELLRRADVAMYVAKRSRGGYVVYSPDDDEHNPERLLLLGDLRRAILRDELALFWQPQVKFTTGQIVGMEALVRWNHPRRGLLPPGAFVPLAERTGVIKPLHDWVLRAALRQCKAWSAGWDAPVVAVNTSMPNVLDPGYIDIVQRMLLETEVPASSLCVEITESVIMGDPERARGVVSDLRTMGVRVSIDDFGTGYSSLGYLQQLDVNEIKIDKSFVTGVADDRARAAIVRTSIDLGHHFGLEVVAEGVEDQRSWDILFTTACDTAQGYHISPPLPPSEVVRSLAERGWIRPGAERGFRLGT